MTRIIKKVITWNTTGKLKKFRVNLQDAEKMSPTNMESSYCQVNNNNKRTPVDNIFLHKVYF